MLADRNQETRHKQIDATTDASQTNDAIGLQDDGDYCDDEASKIGARECDRRSRRH
jgi:hypothetical protein